MPATDPEPRKRPATQTGPTMRALLASCAAAEAVSRPPMPPAPEEPPQSKAA